MKICFLMYPWESINPKRDSSIRIIHECVKRGHEVAITTASNLTIRDSDTFSFCQLIESPPKVSTSMRSFHRDVKLITKLMPLREFDVIFMRDNPPLDPLVLNFLDSIKDDVFIVNAIDGLREANNKIYTAAYYDPNSSFIPKTHVSKNIDYLLQVIDESDDERLTLKPLD